MPCDVMEIGSVLSPSSYPRCQPAATCLTSDLSSVTGPPVNKARVAYRESEDREGLLPNTDTL